MAAQGTIAAGGWEAYRAVHIVHLVPAGLHPYSGVMTMTVELALGLVRAGHRVEVWRLAAWDDPGYAGIAGRLEDGGVPVVSTRPVGPFHRRPDLFHLHGVFNVGNAIARSRLPGPYCHSPHGGYAAEALRRRRASKSMFLRLVDRPMLENAAAVFALSAVEAAEVAALGLRKPAVVIANGAPRPPDHDPGELRAELGLADEPLVVFVGRIDLVHKNLAVLVAALQAARLWHLAVVGPDFRSGEARLRGLAAELGVAERVHFTGPRRGAALYGALSSATVFALPSRWEGFPMVVLEAASVGTPSLVSPAVEARTGVAAAGAGQVVRDDAWGAALAAWNGDRRDKRAAALAYAAAHSWDEIATRYAEAYARCMDPVA